MLMSKNKKNTKEATKRDENVVERLVGAPKRQWEEDLQNNRIEVTEDNVADVVSMMTAFQ
jgi:ATP-dependent Clp protease ATP-binding subunit ClpC